jgi:hypothetical protein
MDARYFRERAETCLRLAKELPWNNPGYFHLLDIAENLQRRAAELKAQEDKMAATNTERTNRDVRILTQSVSRRFRV